MKNYYTQTLTFVLFLLCAAGVARAQHVWQNSLPQPAAAAAPVARASDATEGKIYLGHCKYSDYIYPWDGLSQSMDCRVGVAVKFTRDMFKDYIGGEVKSLRIGWDEQNEKGELEMFVRTSFNGENIASGEGMVAFGWNELNLLEGFTIPDVDELVVGYYTDLKANLCCIPKFYPQNVDNSCFLYSGETDTQGKEIWYDLKSLGTMAIMLVVHDTKGQFHDLAAVDDLRYEHIGKKGEASAAIFTITNRGSNPISSLEMTTVQGEASASNEVKLSSSIQPAESKRVTLPLTYLASGAAQARLTKVNGNAVADPVTKDVSFIAVPSEVAANYVFRPTVEFYGSENSYMVPTYFDDYFMADFQNYTDRMTLINQHLDDQFMTGKNDALYAMLSLCAGDSMKVFLPNLSIDRTDYLNNVSPVAGTPFLYGIPYPGMATGMYDAALQRPTFASVSVVPTWNEDNSKILIDVTGDVAPGVMPEGENLNLTVYLMEKEVVSDSQKFWDDKEGELPASTYTHYNVIRELLNSYWGKALTLEADGSFSKHFEARMYDDYNPANLSVIAIINRGPKNDNLSREIINSTEAAVPVPAGIESLESARGLEVRDGEAFLDGAPAEVYDLAGQRVQLLRGSHGVYLVKSKVRPEAPALKVAF